MIEIRDLNMYKKSLLFLPLHVRMIAIGKSKGKEGAQ